MYYTVRFDFDVTSFHEHLDCGLIFWQLYKIGSLKFIQFEPLLVYACPSFLRQLNYTRKIFSRKTSVYCCLRAIYSIPLEMGEGCTPSSDPSLPFIEILKLKFYFQQSPPPRNKDPLNFRTRLLVACMHTDGDNKICMAVSILIPVLLKLVKWAGSIV